MARNYGDWIELIGYTYTSDAIGQQIKTPTKKGVFAMKQSVGQNEFFKASEEGFKAEFTFKIALVDYDGEKELTYNNKTYDIYRTFDVGDRIVLYAKAKIGVRNG